MQHARSSSEAGTGGIADSRFSRSLGCAPTVRNVFFPPRVNRWAGYARIGNFLALGTYLPVVGCWMDLPNLGYFWVRCSVTIGLKSTYSSLLSSRGMFCDSVHAHTNCTLANCQWGFGVVGPPPLVFSTLPCDAMHHLFQRQK